MAGAAAAVSVSVLCEVAGAAVVVTATRVVTIARSDDHALASGFRGVCGCITIKVNRYFVQVKESVQLSWF